MGQIPAAGGLGRLFSVRWPNWIEHYAVNGFVHEDIVIQETIRSLEPFTWTELKTRRPGAGTRIFEACDSFGWPDGLTVPVDGPDFRRGFVSLAAPSSLKFLQNAERAELIELSLSAYVKSWTLASVRNEASPSLSVREQEALSHVAKGRDDAAIAFDHVDFESNGTRPRRTRQTKARGDDAGSGRRDGHQGETHLSRFDGDPPRGGTACAGCHYFKLGLHVSTMPAVLSRGAPFGPCGSAM